MSLINNYFKKKYIDAVTKELGVEYDPSLVIVKDEDFKKAENRVWYYASNANDLEVFYKSGLPAGGILNNRDFYRQVRGKTPRVHVPVAKLITNTMVNLVFSESPDILVSNGNKKSSEVLNRELVATLQENGKDDFLKKMEADLSYSGACAIKFVIDRDISKNVIMQVYPKEDIEVTKKYGRTMSITFKDYFDGEYTLKSEYGRGYINYKLFKKNKEVPLDELSESRGLKDVYFINKDGTPSTKLMAVYIENNIGANSDYDGCIDLFEAIDEIKSAMLHIQRALKPKRGVPSSLCEIDRDSGKTILPNDWDREEVLLEVEDPEAKIKNMSDVSFTSPNLSSYQEQLDKTLREILNVVGLSLGTIGDNDGGSNSSSLSLNVREKSSLRKRAAIITRFDQGLKELGDLILLYNHAIWGDITVLDDTSSYEYTVDFSEYASPSMSDMIKDLSTAINSGLVSRKYALEELYGDDIPEEQVNQMLLDIQKDRGELQNLDLEVASDNNIDTNKENN